MWWLSGHSHHPPGCHPVSGKLSSIQTPTPRTFSLIVILISLSRLFILSIKKNQNKHLISFLALSTPSLQSGLCYTFRRSQTGGSEERSKEELSLYDCSLYGDISPHVLNCANCANSHPSLCELFALCEQLATCQADGAATKPDCVSFLSTYFSLNVKLNWIFSLSY